MQEGQNNFLKDWLKNPTETEGVSRDELKRLAEQYPASNFIRALLARTALNGAGAQEQVGCAAVYSSNREALYFLLHDPAKLAYVHPVIPPKRVAESAATAAAVLEAAPEILPVKEVIESESPEDGKSETLEVEEAMSDSEITVEEIIPVNEATENVNETESPEAGKLESGEDGYGVHSEIAEDKTLTEEIISVNEATENVNETENPEVGKRKGQEDGIRNETGDHQEISDIKEAEEFNKTESREDGKFESLAIDDEVYEEIVEFGPITGEKNLPVKEAGETENWEDEGPESQIIEDEVYEEIGGHDALVQKAENSSVKEAQEEAGKSESQEVDDEVYEEIAEHTPAFTPQKEHQPEAEIEDEVFEEINEAPLAESKQEAGLSAQPEKKNSEVFRVETIVPESDELPVALRSQTGEVKTGFTDEHSQAPHFHIETVVPESDEPPVEVKSSAGQASFFTDKNFPVGHFGIETIVPDAEKPYVEEASAEQQTQPSRYYDEKMPYSFMWWLDKTRKEHAQTYQPYASPGYRTETAVEPTAETPPLEQQYIEHIFHLQSVDELDRSTQSRTVPFSIPRKEDPIIEKFIREEPQISTPRPEKLDTENKARKSTEDHLEMVSETLARIYTEQMLYHKAIDTYQKLGLKYPDKSTYFAARIKELNDKIR